jgi:serpin B
MAMAGGGPSGGRGIGSGRARGVALVSALGLAAVCVVGCGSSPSAVSGLHFASVKASGVPASDPAAQAAAVSGLNSFGLELYRQLGSGNGNLVVSPQTLDEVLTMLLPGTTGVTESQLASVLGYSALDPAQAAYALGKVEAASLARASADGETLTEADDVWAQQGLDLRTAYLNILAGGFGAGVWQTDFKGDPAASTNAVNQEVSQETKGLIPQLFPSGTITSQTRLVLTAASYFKAPWTNAFDPSNTMAAPFTTSSGTKVQAQMMSQSTSFKYGSGAGWQAVELPYGKNGNLAMDVILPTSAAPGSLATLRTDLTGNGLGQITGTLRYRPVVLSLPRFTLASTEASLNTQIEQLGATALFGQNAGLGGLFSNDSEQLQLADVLQQAYIQVSEQGTVAAAAAGGEVGVGAVAAPSNQVIFDADHPFVYLIRDTVSGQVLYLGQVNDPS